MLLDFIRKEISQKLLFWSMAILPEEEKLRLAKAVLPYLSDSLRIETDALWKEQRERGERE